MCVEQNQKQESCLGKSEVPPVFVGAAQEGPWCYGCSPGGSRGEIGILMLVLGCPDVFVRHYTAPAPVFHHEWVYQSTSDPLPVLTLVVLGLSAAMAFTGAVYGQEMNLEVDCSDTPGMVANITSTIFREGYNIGNFDGRQAPGDRFRMTVTVKGDPRRMLLMRNAIREMPGMNRCDLVRMSGSPDSPTLSGERLAQA